MRKPSSIPPVFHMVGALGALALAAVVATGSLGDSPTAAIHPAAVQITVDHRLPASLRIRASLGRSPGLLSFSHDNGETLRLTVPESWTVQEVRNAPLSSVPADPARGGNRRWHLPAGVLLTLRTGGDSSLTVQNPSGIPLHVHHTLVPLSSGEEQEESVLVTEEEVRIW